MLDIYGLAAAHLGGAWQRNRDETMARYDRGPATVAAPWSGVISRFATFVGTARRRAARSAATMDRPAGKCGDVPPRCAAA